VCPGEDSCLKYKSALNKKTVCERCPNNESRSKLYELEGVEGIIPWLSHLFYLEGLKNVGAHFMINDLTKEEWDGLMIIASAKEDIRKEKEKKEEERRNLQRVMKGAKKLR